MDPISAIGLVSGILTFVGAAEKVLKLSWTLYNSVEGSSEETAMRLKVAESMAGMTTRMIPADSLAPTNPEDRALVTLARECNNLTNDIRTELHGLKPRRRKSKAQSVIAAMKTLLAEPKIKDLEKNLQSCRDQLHFHIAALSSENLKQLLATCKEDGSKLTQLDISVAQLKQTLQGMTGMEVKCISDEALNQLKSVLHVGQDALNGVAQDRILRGIKAGFEDMSYRYQSIERPFGQTFEWVMDLGENSPAAAKFSGWLSSGDGIFHICGKLGSGKSTLMKKLCSDDRTRETLETWARGRKLVIASFFFYALGSDPRQRSVMGLYRTLLYQILAASPDLTQTLFPEQWVKALSQPRVQSDYEILDDDIRRAYDLLSKQHGGSSLGNDCFALFIDGLDEYEATPAVDRREMVRLLADLAASNPGRFKVCVSSRMENPFMDLFSEDTRLYLHKLTRTDMEEYVKGNLQCVGTERERDQLASSITTKAEGVFLWVVLVVQRIRKQSDDGARFPRLLSEVESLPNELSQLFQRMLESIPEGTDRRLLNHTVSLLHFLGDIRDAKKMYLWLDLGDFYSLEDYEADQRFAERPLFPEQECESASERDSRARRQLRGICGGLVEADEVDDLSFTHRSVRDFFKQDRVQVDMRDEAFNDMDALSQLKLASMRRAWSDSQRQNVGGTEANQSWPLRHHAILTACLVELRRKRQLDAPPFGFLECLDTMPQLSLSATVRRALASGKTAFDIIIAARSYGGGISYSHYGVCHTSRVRHWYDGMDRDLLHASRGGRAGSELVKGQAGATAVAVPWRAASGYSGTSGRSMGDGMPHATAVVSPLLTELCSGRLEYPLWRFERIRDKSPEPDELAMLVYTAVGASIGRWVWSDSEVDHHLDGDLRLESSATAAIFLQLLLDRHIVSPNLVTQLAFGGESDFIRIAAGDQRLSIWQHFICWWATLAATSGEFAEIERDVGAGHESTNDCSDSEQDKVGTVLEAFIRNGADLELMLKITFRGVVDTLMYGRWLLLYTLEITPCDGTTALELDVVLTTERQVARSHYPYGPPNRRVQELSGREDGFEREDEFQREYGFESDDFMFEDESILGRELEVELGRLPDSPLSLRDWIGYSRLPNKRGLFALMDRQGDSTRQ